MNSQNPEFHTKFVDSTKKAYVSKKAWKHGRVTPVLFLEEWANILAKYHEKLMEGYTKYLIQVQAMAAKY